MEDQPISSAEAKEQLVEEERPENLHSREPPPRFCGTMHSPHSAPSFANYYGAFQPPGPSPAPDNYVFPMVPLQQPPAYGGSRFILMQTPMFPSEGGQYMPMGTSVPVQAISVNENYRAGYHNVHPTRSLVCKESVGGSATCRSPPSSSSRFEQPLATSTPRSSFSQGPSEQRSSPTKRASITRQPSSCSELPLNCSSRVMPVHGTPVPSTFPPVSTLTFQHVPPSNLMYPVSPPVGQRTFTPTFSAGAAVPPSQRILSPSVPSRFGATYPSPAPPTDYVICSGSRHASTRLPQTAQTYDLSDSGFESVGSNLNETSRSPTNSSPGAGNISDMQGRYYISGGQISFDPPLDLSSNDVTYSVPLQSSQNVSAYNQSNLQISSIQELTDRHSHSLDGSGVPEMTTAEQDWIDAKPVENSEFYDVSSLPQVPGEWIPPPDISSTADNFTGQWRSTPESPYPLDKPDLQMSSIRERSRGSSQTFDTSEMTAIEQDWIEAKPVKLHSIEEASSPAQTINVVLAPSSPDDFNPPTRLNHVGVQTPREWTVDGMSAAVQTPCGWEGGPTVTGAWAPLAYCAGSCPTKHDLSKRKRRRKKVSCDHCKEILKEKTQKEDTVEDSDSIITDIESLDPDSAHSASQEQTLKSPRQTAQQNKDNQESQGNKDDQEPHDIEDGNERQNTEDTVPQDEEEIKVTSNVPNDSTEPRQ